jgi:chromosome segregation ATPase
MLKAEIDRLAARIQELELEGQGKAAEIRELRNEKSALKTENDALKARRAGQGKHTERVRSEISLRHPPQTVVNMDISSRLGRKCSGGIS